MMNGRRDFLKTGAGAFAAVAAELAECAGCFLALVKSLGAA